MTSYIPTPSPTDIAVIGMSGRFPGARSVPEYWRNLCNGVESVKYWSEEELLEAGVPADILADPDYVRAAYPMEDADRFDAAFFGYSPRESRFIDPQQRILLECAWQALENGGYAGGTERQVGVYVGSSLNTYLLFTGLAEQFQTEPVLTLMSNDKDFLATRIGYKLQLEGPCVTVQTACSTSLVAVHMACQSILARECDMALAGGACVKVPLKTGYMYREGGMLSRDGHCRAFDAAATGTIFGSGAGIVVLKRYSDALRDGDTVHAVIKGTSINNDGGRKSSYTAPSVSGLADVVAQAMDFAEVKADAISYIECHGTGTALGDPIEIHALTKAFRSSTSRERYCAIGSVKTNIGHLEAASGIASFIKTVSCLKHRYLPASLHFNAPNPALGLCDSPFLVNSKGRDWTNGHGPRTAAVNSLGVGGTNATVILQEPAPQVSAASRRRWHLLPVSARTAANAGVVREALFNHLHEHPETSLADAAFTLQVGRRAFDFRDFIVVDGEQPNAIDSPVLSNAPAKTEARQLLYLFGNDFDWRIASTLCAEEETYKEILGKMHGDLNTTGNRLCDGQDDPRSIFLFQVALAKLWEIWGISPHAVVGDGIGALAAAHWANAMSLADAFECLEGTARQDLRTSRTDHSSPVIYSSTPTGSKVSPQTLSATPACPDPLEAACLTLLDTYPNAVCLPIGSASALSSTVARLIGKSTAQVLIAPLCRRDADCARPPELLQQAGTLWKLGAASGAMAFYNGETRGRIPLPVSPLCGERHWWSKAPLKR